MNIRAGNSADLDQVRHLLACSPDAAQWLPGEAEFLVAENDVRVTAILVWRSTASDEKEILNIAVHPAFRRRGIALALLAACSAPTTFLEVRETNLGARALYRQAGFQEVGLRKAYYRNPGEAAIVMRR